MRIVIGDLMSAPEQYVCHQCNCVSSRAAHLAYDVFQRFPWADIYSERNGRDNRYEPPQEGLPGNIVVRGDGRDQRLVIAMLAQYYPGKPRFPQSRRDGHEARRRYFAQCLGKIVAMPGVRELAFPWRIGCGAAGGDWVKYQQMIDTLVPGGVDVVVYRRPQDQ